MTKAYLRRSVSIVAMFALLGMTLQFWMIEPAHADTMAQIKLVLSTVKAATTADVTLQFTVPTGVDASTDSITVTFDSGYNLGTFALTDYDFEVGNSGTCSSASFTDKTLAASAAAGTWGVATTGTPKTVVTLTAPTDATTGEVTAGRCVQLRIGSGATQGGAGATVVTNPSAGNYDVDITSELGTTDDSGSGSVSIISNDVVNVTSTVDPYITFTVSDNTIGFSALSTSTGRWATGDLTGGDASGGSTPTAAHTLTLATNAPSGWAITYNGATLTSGSNTITDAATISSDSDGTPGSEQFGISASTDGNATIATGYARGANASWDYVVSTTTTLVSESVGTATETISVSYLANIASTTEAGTYTTNVTYVASGVF